MNLKEALGKIMHSKAGYRVAVAAPNEDSIMEMLEEAVNAGHKGLAGRRYGVHYT